MDMNGNNEFHDIRDLELDTKDDLAGVAYIVYVKQQARNTAMASQPPLYYNDEMRRPGALSVIRNRLNWYPTIDTSKMRNDDYAPYRNVKDNMALNFGNTALSLGVLGIYYCVNAKAQATEATDHRLKAAASILFVCTVSLYAAIYAFFFCDFARPSVIYMLNI